MTMQPKFRVTDDEERLLVSAARDAGLTVSAFAKRAALQHAERGLLVGDDPGDGLQQVIGRHLPQAQRIQDQVNEQLGRDVLTSASGKRLRVVRARICPTPGCIWRKFNDPTARCPTHGKGVDQ